MLRRGSRRHASRARSARRSSSGSSTASRAAAPRPRAMPARGTRATANGQGFERAPRDRIGEQGEVETAAHQLGRLHGPAQRVELAAIDRDAHVAAARTRSAPVRACGRAARASHRVAQAVRHRCRAGPTSFMTYWSRTRSFGCSAIIAGRVPRAVRARPSSDRRVGAAQQPLDAELEERRRALDRGDEPLRDRRSTRRPGRDRRAGRRPGTAPRIAAPTGSNARPRPGPRRRRRTRASPCAPGSSA